MLPVTIVSSPISLSHSTRLPVRDRAVHCRHKVRYKALAFRIVDGRGLFKSPITTPFLGRSAVFFVARFAWVRFCFALSWLLSPAFFIDNERTMIKSKCAFVIEFYSFYAALIAAITNAVIFLSISSLMPSSFSSTTT